MEFEEFALDQFKNIVGRLAATEAMVEMLWTALLSAPQAASSENPTEEEIQRRFGNFRKQVEYVTQQRSLPEDELESEVTEECEKAIENFLQEIERRLKSV